MGLDGIFPFLLKRTLPYAVESVAYVYNLSVASAILSTVLKNVKVIALPKSKDLNDPNNFSSVSILPLFQNN